ncbi:MULTISPECIES: GNAT family N-acetyltransferase [Sphingobacterium]|uniref:GNAT family N-acetyltransferase n=1 Tax=Sphingobacterium TaxID=28453 RepID=UPI0025799A41|nr:MULTISPECIES: GNAT family protein [Sphingobacterium]
MINLKPLSLNDISPFYEWINDDMSIKYSLSLFQSLHTKDQIDHWFHSVINDLTNFNRGIFLNDSNRLIGYAGICNISKANRSGEYFIFIGDRQEWGKGIGSEVTRLILGMGFEELGLHRIMLTVSEPNYAAIKAYQNAGFKLEGRMREACFRDNQFHDKLFMSVLEEEWNNEVQLSVK